MAGTNWPQPFCLWERSLLFKKRCERIGRKCPLLGPKASWCPPFRGKNQFLWRDSELRALPGPPSSVKVRRVGQGSQGHRQKEHGPGWGSAGGDDRWATVIPSLVQCFGGQLLGGCSPLAGGPPVFLASTVPVCPHLLLTHCLCYWLQPSWSQVVSHASLLLPILAWHLEPVIIWRKGSLLSAARSILGCPGSWKFSVSCSSEVREGYKSGLKPYTQICLELLCRWSLRDPWLTDPGLRQ